MPFNLQPHLENELIRLRPVAPGDFEALYAIASDPLIWEQHPSRDRYKREVFENYFAGAVESGGALLVFDRKTDILMGSSRYYGFDEAQSTVCIGYTFIARAYWGGGYNRALKTLMLNHAFRFVNTALFHVGTDNKRSRMAMEKIGGILIGALDMAYYGEQSNPNVVYKIDREAFVAGQ